MAAEVPHTLEYRGGQLNVAPMLEQERKKRRHQKKETGGTARKKESSRPQESKKESKKERRSQKKERDLDRAAEGRSKRHASEASLVEQEDIKARRLQHKYGGVESVSVALEVAFNEMEEDRVEIIKIMGVNVGFNLDGSWISGYGSVCGPSYVELVDIVHGLIESRGNKQ
ncbi:hypothetical protein Tco_0570457 [Tanacetum coccineum]